MPNFKSISIEITDSEGADVLSERSHVDKG